MRRLNGFYVMPRVRLRADQLLAGPNGGPCARIRARAIDTINEFKDFFLTEEAVRNRDFVARRVIGKIITYEGIVKSIAAPD